MIYRKEEFVQRDLDDQEFPIKEIDRLEAMDGSEQRFIGRTLLNMQTPLGLQQIPISFEIQAESPEDAFAKYLEYARPKIEEVRKHIQERIDELRREQKNRIVTPGETLGNGVLRFDDFRSGN